MASKVQSNCLCCGEIFTVDVRNRGRQNILREKRPAERPARRRASAAAGEEAGETRITSVGRNHVARVREWRATHPGYWRSHPAPRARLRYKTLWWCKQLKILKIFLAVRYKTRFDAKVLF